MNYRIISFLALAAIHCVAVSAADYTAQVIDKPIPVGVAAYITNLVQPKALQILENQKPILEFWLAKEAPLAGAEDTAAKGPAALKPAGLLGVAVVSQATRDYRDDELAAGTYTIRFALQPQDGNHLGSADYTYFGVLVPAKLDTTAEAITTYQALVKASGKETASGHPNIFSLRPASASPPSDALKVNEPASDHKSIRIRLPTKTSAQAVEFELVFKGMGKV
jgi:hypothetical protein